MKKIHSFHLPKVNREEHQKHEFQSLNQLAAEESLFEISKLQEHRIHMYENFLRDLSRKSSNMKRYQKSSLSLPRKKDPQQIPPIEMKNFRQTYLQQGLNHESVGITNFVVIDNRKKRRGQSMQPQPKTQRSSLHEQINRKAKYLFRTRNKVKKYSNNEQMFVSSFYCTKIQSTATEEN